MTARRVYRGMYRGTVCLLLSLAAVAQVPQREPFDAALQAFWTARNAGHFDEAAAKREEARRLLERTATDAPQFGHRLMSVTQLYESAGMSRQARSIAEEALSRAEGLGRHASSFSTRWRVPGSRTGTC